MTGSISSTTWLAGSLGRASSTAVEGTVIDDDVVVAAVVDSFINVGDGVSSAGTKVVGGTLVSGVMESS